MSGMNYPQQKRCRGHRTPRWQAVFLPLQKQAVIPSFRVMRPFHPLAARTSPSISATRNLLRHGAYLRRGSSLPRSEPAGVLQRGLLRLARDFGWQLEAWAVFSNHYHFVAHSPYNEPDASSLRAMLSLLHENAAKWVNRLDRSPGRKVWFNYRDTRLTYQKSYLARLNYTHQNAVKHGLVAASHLYPWCSASWFERTASPAPVKAIYRFRTDRMRLDDEFEVAPEW